MAASIAQFFRQLPCWTSDAVLLERYVHERDEAAFAALVSRHGPLVMRLCRRILGDAHAAEDAFQATFLILARKAHSLKQPDALPAWLYGVARRVALKARKISASRSMVSLDDTLPDPRPDPLAELNARELLDILDEEVQRLPLAQRSAFVLCCLEGHTQEEAARMLGWTPGSVRGRLERGRPRLRARLQRRGIALSAVLALMVLGRDRVAAHVPALLLRSTIRAALNGGVGSTASLLANSVLGAMLLPKLAGVMAVTLTFALAASTTMVLLTRGSSTEIPEDTTPAFPVASKAAGDTKPQVRTDALGDPLPPGAIARMGTLRLRGCRGPVLFSPDGKYIVTAGGDGGAQAVFWDRRSGRRVKTVTAREGIIRLVFSPDGKKLAAVGNGGFFNPVWDADSGNILFTFKGREIAFHADGKELISTYSESKGTKVRTFETSTGRQLTKWELSHDWDDGKFDLSLDGRFAAALLERNKSCVLVIYDLVKRAEIKRLRLAKAQPIGFSSDGLRYLVGSEGAISVWEWSSGKQLRSWALNGLNPAGLSQDGRQIAWIGADKNGVDSVWIADVDAGQPRLIRAMTFDSSIRLTFSPDGKSVAALTAGNAVVLFDSRNGRDQLPLAAHEAKVWRVEYSADGRHVMTRDSYRLLVWEAATGRLLHRLPDDLPAGETILLKTLSHGRIISVTLADGTFHLRNAVTAKELRRLKGKDGYYADAVGDVSAVSVDGSSAAILGSTAIRIYDLESGAIRCQFRRDYPVWGMNFTEDGRILEVTMQDFQKGLLPRFYDAQTGSEAEAPAKVRSRKRRDWSWYVDATEAKSGLRALRLLDSRGRLAFAGEDGLFTHIREAPDGRYLAVEGRTGLPHVIDQKDKRFVRVWDTVTRRLVLELDEKHQIGGFSPDGRIFVSSSYSTGTIHLWEIGTGRERLRLAGHTPGDVTIGFRPDGRVLVSGGADTQVFLWDVTGRSSDGVRHESRHSPEKMRELWQALASDDAQAAYRAMWALVDASAQTVAWMRRCLPPVAPLERRHLMRLIAELDSDEFMVRNRANAELERLGELAEPALRDILAAKPSLECRRRCQDLLTKLAVLSSECLRAVRAIEALEYIATAEARAFLEELSRGAPEVRLTQEAKAGLQRLTHPSRARSAVE